MYKMNLEYQIPRKLSKTIRVITLRLTDISKKLPLVNNGTAWFLLSIITETHQYV